MDGRLSSSRPGDLVWIRAIGSEPAGAGREFLPRRQEDLPLRREDLPFREGEVIQAVDMDDHGITVARNDGERLVVPHEWARVITVDPFDGPVELQHRVRKAIP